MTIQDKETIQRALGIIDGAICVAPKSVRNILATATTAAQRKMELED